MSSLEESVILDYNNLMSMLSIQKKYKIDYSKVNSILKKNGIEKISSTKRLNPDIKEDYFSKIDSMDKAYWIGWILTDGSIDNHNGLQIGLQKNDYYILDIFQKDLGLKNHVKICKYDGIDQCRFSIMCKQYKEDLKKYGVVENKTKELKFPYNKIDKKYDSSFIRGLFDGDGGFTLGFATRFIKERGKSYTNPYSEFSFTGTYDMCDGFQNTILSHIELKKKKIHTNNSMFHVRWSNREEILKICDFMYENKTDHFLQRKFDKYMNLLKKEYNI